MIEKRWKILEADEELVSKLSSEFKIPRVMAKVLVIRGITTIEDFKKFFADDSSELYSPFLLKSIDVAVARVLKALEKEERIVIYGDYDVDGITSISILYSFLEEIGADVDYYIPNRFEEGYGINKDAIIKLKQDGYDLIISVDTGITAVKEVEVANEIGLDVIITDHHECKETIPNAVAVINPKRSDDNYPFKQLAGVGVAYKLITAINESIEKPVDISKHLEIVAIGTIADLVKLESENRLFVKIAFKTISNSSNYGIKALFDIAGINDKKISSGLIGFQIAPRLNASGRLKSAKLGVELFLSKTYERAFSIAQDLDAINTDRRTLEKEIFEEAVNIIESDSIISSSSILLVAKDGWNKGVIGIVASRLVEKYYKPVIILAIDGDIASGSARSIEGFSIYDALNSVNDVFTKFGGHTMAAGMSLDKGRINELRDRLNSYGLENLTEETLTKKVYIDDVVHSSEINIDYIEKLRELEPFGMGNREPIFEIEDVVQKIYPMGKENNHIKIIMRGFEAVGFNMGEYANYISEGQSVKLAGTLNVNRWKDRVNSTLYIRDIKLDAYLLETIYESVKRHKTVNYLEENIDFNLDEDECRQFYILLNTLDKVNTDRIYYTKLIYKYKIDIRKSLIMLEIFSELGIADYELEDFYFTFRLIKGKKVDLKSSKLYNYCLK